uniref:Putative ovule protein n=1 Tax=Solanum chacoense TaxID=4108 RepID=A0A0V0GZP0_SOLCH
MVLFLIEYMGHIVNVCLDVFYTTKDVFNSMQSRDILAPGYSLWVKFLYCLNFCGMDMILKRMHDCTWIGK